MVLHGPNAVNIARSFSSSRSSRLYRSSESVVTARSEIARWYYMFTLMFWYHYDPPSSVAYPDVLK